MFCRFHLNLFKRQPVTPIAKGGELGGSGSHRTNRLRSAPPCYRPSTSDISLSGSRVACGIGRLCVIGFSWASISAAFTFSRIAQAAHSDMLHVTSDGAFFTPFICLKDFPDVASVPAPVKMKMSLGDIRMVMVRGDIFSGGGAINFF